MKNEFHCRTHKIISNMLLIDASILAHLGPWWCHVLHEKKNQKTKTKTKKPERIVRIGLTTWRNIHQLLTLPLLTLNHKLINSINIFFKSCKKGWNQIEIVVFSNYPPFAPGGGSRQNLGRCVPPRFSKVESPDCPELIFWGLKVLSTYMYRITVIFGTLKDGSLLINIFASNNVSATETSSKMASTLCRN